MTEEEEEERLRDYLIFRRAHARTHTQAGTKRSKGCTGWLYNPSLRIVSSRNGDKKEKILGSLLVHVLINSLGLFLTAPIKAFQEACDLKETVLTRTGA